MYLSHTELDPEPITLIIPDEQSGMRLDAALSAIIPELSRNRITNWIKEGLVLVNERHLKPKDKVLGGENITITPPLSDENLAQIPENIPLNIVFEDEHVLVINKPAGLTVHPGNGNLSGTLLNGLLYHYPNLNQIPRVGIVHRLDKDTTGLMVIAKSLLAQTKLVMQLQTHSVYRIYNALIEGQIPAEGTIKKNIGRDPKNRIRMTTLDFGGKEAVTHYRTLEQFENTTLIECRLETGRTHQIRVHLKSIGHPLLGDLTYGSGKINYPDNVKNAILDLNRQALHALKLGFRHPVTNKELLFTSKLTPDFNTLLNELRGSEENYEMEDDETEENDWEVIYAK